MSFLRLSAEGRGSNYPPSRGLLESALKLLYTGDWPATLWQLTPWSREVEVARLTLPMLATESAPLRIGFVSDIHIGPTTPRVLLETAFAHLASANLDVLLLGGDYVFLEGTQERAEFLASLVERVPARRKIGVLGNHDLWTTHEVIERELQRVGVELLFNESRQLLPSHEGLAIVGLDDPWTGTLDVKRAFRDVGDASAVIVLCHSPDGMPDSLAQIEALRNGPPAFYICGHTHGGHMAAPWGPIVVPGPVGKVYPRGLYDLGPMKLYVSRGVGGVEVPVRTYARPEVVVMELVARS